MYAILLLVMSLALPTTVFSAPQIDTPSLSASILDTSTQDKPSFSQPSKSMIAPLLERAESGDPIAQYQLANHYRPYASDANSLQNARYWYQQAANKGHIGAQKILADDFERGKLGKPNLSEALYWQLRLALQGDIEAQRHVGRLIETQSEAFPSNTLAKIWYRQAAPTDMMAQANYERLLEAEFNRLRGKQLADSSQADLIAMEDQTSQADQTAKTHLENIHLESMHLESMHLERTHLRIMHLRAIELMAIIVSAVALIIVVAIRWKTHLIVRCGKREASSEDAPHQAKFTLFKQVQLKQVQLKKTHQKLLKQHQELSSRYHALQEQLAQKKPFARETQFAQNSARPSNAITFEIACATLGYCPDDLPNAKTVKMRYKMLSKVYHPDRDGSKDEMQRLNHALELVMTRVNKT